MAEEPKPPAALAAGGRALWRQIVRAAAEEDQELSALEQRHLLSACQLTDMAVNCGRRWPGRTRLFLAIWGSRRRILCLTSGAS
ncbi:MAG: hypothetical protein JWR32_2219 [Mycobacterium sp.]|jgi:hypothetical protein|nr:hypothetical protein [Mycobacterium sp.]